MPKSTKKAPDNVIDFYSGKPLSEVAQERFIRLAPENDGLCMLYTMDSKPDQFFSIPILCWGLRWNGDVVGLVPWMDSVYACPDIQDTDNGNWEAYYDPDVDQVFHEAPLHKTFELETAVAYFENHLDCEADDTLQEIPDNIGTHALLIDNDKQTLNLTEVISWRLQGDGSIHGTLVDESKTHTTPILVGDDCLYAAVDNPQFFCYFSHKTANEIKNHEPEAMATIARLLTL